MLARQLVGCFSWGEWRGDGGKAIWVRKLLEMRRDGRIGVRERAQQDSAPRNRLAAGWAGRAAPDPSPSAAAGDGTGGEIRPGAWVGGSAGRRPG